jgi:hypothetical protein
MATRNEYPGRELNPHGDRSPGDFESAVHGLRDTIVGACAATGATQTATDGNSRHTRHRTRNSTLPRPLRLSGGNTGFAV